MFSAFLMLVAMASCQTAAPEDSLKTSIEKMEVEIKKDMELDTAIAARLTSAYVEYAELHKEDSISPYYLSRAADIYKEVPGGALKAVNTYNKVIRTYPEHELKARSVFMIGYVFDDKLNDTERASKSYAHFISQYPDHPLAADARNLLTMLEDTLSEEEMVEMWMKQNQRDTNNINSQE